ncbi:MAG: DUF3747 domain-containing protein [Leptolyngbyaceae bacterium]|nr:DUF3747 domain-containing protein [Leptolyngbyaceae bacterium]
MKFPSLALLAALSLTPVMTPLDAAASLFQQAEVNNDVIAIASPIGNTSHQLLILEQLGSSQQCWAESGDRVTPLLLDFDFTGICNRATDSNGYSVRVGNEDLGFDYSLRLVSRDGILRLVAVSNRDFGAPPIEVGRAPALPGEFVSIQLNPGWRITQRSYNGQTLGHYYLTNDQSLSALLQNGSPSPATTIAVQSSPSPSPTQSSSSSTASSGAITLGDQPTPLLSSVPIPVEPVEEPFSVSMAIDPAEPDAVPIAVEPFDAPSIPIAVNPVEPSAEPIAVQPAPTSLPSSSTSSTSPLPAPSSSASLYQSVEIAPQDVIAMASPVGERDYQLVIVQQLDSTQECWAQEGDRVNPLLLEFDFFGICDRAGSSSGYSVRLAGEDLGFQYGVRLVSEGDTLRLVARSTRNPSAPAIEIGQAPLHPGEIVAVTLNPGWRITKRSYNGEEIRHYYLTHDQPLSAFQSGNAPVTAQPSPTLIASQSTSSPSLPSVSQPAQSPSLPPVSQPGDSPAPALPVQPAPAPTNVSSLPTVIVPLEIPGSTVIPPVIPSETPVPLIQDGAFIYRVAIPASTLELQEQVQAVVPNAFRRVVDGAVVMQVGVFRDRQAAVDLQEQLQQEGLTAMIQQEEAE